MPFAEIAESFFKPAVRDLVPYEPGKPVEEVQRELGLERVIKLASNEGPLGRFPEALEALSRAVGELNRYPDGGSWRLRDGAGGAARRSLRGGRARRWSDGVVDYLSQLALDPGDEIVCGWPSFPSYVIDALKIGAVPKSVPLRDHRYDLDAMLDAVRRATKLVYMCHPNNPTGTMNTRAELDAYFDARARPRPDGARPGLLRVHRRPGLRGRGQEYVKAGRSVVVLRTFSKIYGLAGLRVGYAVGPAELVTAIGKVRRAFDVNALAQVAALASLDAPDELARRRQVNAEGLVQLERILREHGSTAGVRRELPLRRGRRGLAAALRAAPARGRDRPSDGRVRRCGSDPRHCRHAGGKRLVRRGAG